LVEENVYLEVKRSEKLKELGQSVLRRKKKKNRESR